MDWNPAAPPGLLAGFPCAMKLSAPSAQMLRRTCSGTLLIRLRPPTSSSPIGSGRDRPPMSSPSICNSSPCSNKLLNPPFWSVFMDRDFAPTAEFYAVYLYLLLIKSFTILRWLQFLLWSSAWFLPYSVIPDQASGADFYASTFMLNWHYVIPSVQCNAWSGFRSWFLCHYISAIKSSIDILWFLPYTVIPDQDSGADTSVLYICLISRMIPSIQCIYSVLCICWSSAWFHMVCTSWSGAEFHAVYAIKSSIEILRLTYICWSRAWLSCIHPHLIQQLNSMQYICAIKSSIEILCCISAQDNAYTLISTWIPCSRCMKSKAQSKWCPVYLLIERMIPDTVDRSWSLK